VAGCLLSGETSAARIECEGPLLWNFLLPQKQVRVGHNWFPTSFWSLKFCKQLSVKLQPCFGQDLEIHWESTGTLLIRAGLPTALPGGCVCPDPREHRQCGFQCYLWEEWDWSEWFFRNAKRCRGEKNQNSSTFIGLKCRCFSYGAPVCCSPY